MNRTAPPGPRPMKVDMECDQARLWKRILVTVVPFP